MLVNTRRALTAILLCGVLFAYGARSGSLEAQAPPRAIYVSALDDHGNVVEGLGPADFIVREDKVAREVLRVEPATDPMQIAVLVDNSQSAESHVNDYRKALAAFVTGVTANPALRNQVAIFTLSQRPTINTEYTSNRDQLLKGADRIFSFSGTAAYVMDGIIETSQGMTKRSAARPVIVAVISDGPELSDRPYPRVLDPLFASGASLFVISIGRPITDPLDYTIVLGRGTKETGGVLDSLLSVNGLTGRMKQLADELTHQYRVTYARPNSLIPPERITVETPKPGVEVRGTPVKVDKDQERR